MTKTQFPLLNISYEDKSFEEEKNYFCGDLGMGTVKKMVSVRKCVFLFGFDQHLMPLKILRSPRIWPKTAEQLSPVGKKCN